MASVPKLVAITRLTKTGAQITDYDYTIYIDAICRHCDSNYKIGELSVHEGQVSVQALEDMLQECERRL